MRLILNIFLFLFIQTSLIASDQISTKSSESLLVKHLPNPTEGQYLKNSNMYKWIYQTSVKNNHTKPLQIKEFGIYFNIEGNWEKRNLNNRNYTNTEFSKWYAEGDSLINGWIAPGNTAVSSNNWHSWNSPICVPVKWAYTAIDEDGKEYYGEAIVNLNPAPVPLKGGTIIFPKYYSFKIGDDISWAQPDYNDSNWEKRNNPSDFPPEARGTIFWTRTKLIVDSSLWNKPLGFSLNCRGAVDVFLDGKLLYKYGAVGNSVLTEEAIIHVKVPRPQSIVFNSTLDSNKSSSQHILAFRQSSYFLQSSIWNGVDPDVSFGIGDLNKMSKYHAGTIRKATTHQLFLVGIFLAFGLIHSLLFLFYPKFKANIYFAVISILICANAYLNFQDWFFTEPAIDALWIIRLGNTSVGLLLLAVLRFTYSLVYPKLPRIFFFFAIVSISLILISWIFPFAVGQFGFIFVFLFVFEVVRVISVIRIKKYELLLSGSGILLYGITIVALAAVYQLLTIDLEILPSLWQYIDFPTLFYAELVLMICVSIFLSKNFGNTNKQLERKLIEVKTLSDQTIKQEVEKTKLELENSRKTKELEEARELQLSMLPQELPNVDNLEFAVYMKPATEVGGDYYDFNLNEDGSLTAVVGDATGHGLNAGILVAITKGILNSLKQETNLLEILKKSSAAIKAMGFNKLYMALTLVKFFDNKLQITSAGMPFALIYKHQSGTVEEIKLKGMPLGSVINFPYQIADLNLDVGDTLLLMSDGLPEMFNDKKELLGFDKTKELFANTANDSPENIINNLIKAGEEWANGTEQLDDVTLLVAKVKNI